MKTVHKYPMPATDVLVHIPQGGKIVHFAMQGEIPTLWALVDTEQPKELRRFAIAGTGHALPENADWQHRGSALLHEGTLVLHCFENVDYVTHQRGGQPN